MQDENGNELTGYNALWECALKESRSEAMRRCGEFGISTRSAYAELYGETDFDFYD